MTFLGRVTVLFYLCLIIGACQAPGPTQIYTRSKTFKRAGDRLQRPKGEELKPIELTAESFIIDARSPFTYSLSHLPHSINLSWREFTDQREPFRGRLQKDLYSRTRRLARLGISPESRVIVIGEGNSGNGEEGRLAWTLKYLGIENVDYVSREYFAAAKWTNESDQPLREAAKPWQPNLAKDLVVSRSEITSLLLSSEKLNSHKEKSENNNKTKKTQERVLEKLTKAPTLIIDVRTSGHYLMGPHLNLRPHAKMINIDWTEFINNKGRPKIRMIDKLFGVGISPEQRIIVLSQEGVKSAAVTMALQDMGYKNAGNFPGGYDELITFIK